MATSEKPTKLVVDVGDSDLYRAITHAAGARHQPVQAVVVEALQEWLERFDDEEDLAAIVEAEDDPTVSWEEVKEEMRAARTAQRAE